MAGCVELADQLQELLDLFAKADVGAPLVASPRHALGSDAGTRQSPLCQEQRGQKPEAHAHPAVVHEHDGERHHPQHEEHGHLVVFLRHERTLWARVVEGSTTKLVLSAVAFQHDATALDRARDPPEE